MSGEPVTGEIVGGRFALQRKIGKGGAGTVWLAEDLVREGGPVALKILHPEHRADQRLFERFRREIDVLRGLDHPNIVRPILWSVDDARAFVAMEYVEGQPLHRAIRAHIDAGTRFSLSDVASIFDALSSSVAYAHSRQVIHRDLKPENVMVAALPEGMLVKVLDFGIAKLLDSGHGAETTVGRVFGSPAYMSPEQCAGLEIDGRADIFALGALLFELLALKRAWIRDPQDRPTYEQENLRAPWNQGPEVIRRILSGARPKPSSYREDATPEIDVVVVRAMAVKPESRFQRADELREAALAALGDTGSRVGALIEPPTDSPNAITDDDDDGDGESRAEPHDTDTDPDKTARMQVGGIVDPLPVVIPRPLTRSGSGNTTDTPPVPETTDPTPSVDIQPTRTAPMRAPPSTTLPPAAHAGAAPPAQRFLTPLRAVAAAGLLLITVGVMQLSARTAAVQVDLRTLPPAPHVEAPRAQPSLPSAETPPAPASDVPSPRPPENAPENAPESAPEIAPERGPRKAASPRRPAPASTPAPKAPFEPRRYAELHALLARLKRDPADGALFTSLSDGILAAAQKLPESPARTSIVRRTTASAIVGDVAGLETSLRELSQLTAR